MKGKIGRAVLTIAIEVILALAIGYLGTYFYSYALSPLYSAPNGIGTDGNITAVLGHLLANGGIPYVDALDHKGPYVFYFAYLAVTLDPVWGFFILQGLGNAVIAFCLIDIARRLKIKRGWLLLYSCIAFLGVFLVNEGAATDSAFAPVSYLAVYLFFLAYSSGKRFHLALAVFFDGLFLGIAAFSRLSNVIPEVAVAIGLVCVAVCSKRPKDLFLYVPLGFAGILKTCLIPILISYSGGYLEEMLLWTFEKNFVYAGKVEGFSLEGAVVFPLALFFAILSLCFIIPTRKWLSSFNKGLFPFLLISLILLTIDFGVFSNFYHYMAHGYPFYLLVFAYFCSYASLHWKRKFVELRWFLASLAMISAVAYVGIMTGYYYVNDHVSSHNYVLKEKELTAKDYIEEHYSGEGDPEVYAIDCNCSVYLNLGYYPDYPVFSTQTWWLSNGVLEEKQGIIDYVDSKVDYLFLGVHSSFLRDLDFQSILEDGFQKIEELTCPDSFYFYERI